MRITHPCPFTGLCYCPLKIFNINFVQSTTPQLFKIHGNIDGNDEKWDVMSDKAAWAEGCPCVIALVPLDREGAHVMEWMRPLTLKHFISYYCGLESLLEHILFTCYTHLK